MSAAHKLYTTCSNKMSSQIYSCSVHHLLESPSSLLLGTLKKDRQITFFTVYTVYMYKIYIIIIIIIIIIYLPLQYRSELSEPKTRVLNEPLTR